MKTTKSSKVQTCPLHMHGPHVNTSCVLFFTWLYLNLCQIIILGLTTAKKNFYQPVLCLDVLWLCHQEACLSVMTCRTCTLTTLLSDSKTKVLVHGATARPWPTWLSSSTCMSSTCILTYVDTAHCLYKFLRISCTQKNKAKSFLQKTKRMTCHTQPLKKAKKQGKCHYPASVPSHPKILHS